MRNTFIVNRKLKIILVAILAISSNTNSLAQTGDWNVITGPPGVITNIHTVTPKDVAIGTGIPDGKTEIYLGCTPINGLVVTKEELCSQPYFSMPGGLFAEQELDPVIQEETPFTVPFNFSVGSTLPLTLLTGPKYSVPIPNNALIWARTNAQMPPGPGGGGPYSSTRFVVMPDGKTGINVYNPRATLDVRNMATAAYNLPAAIFGVNVMSTQSGPSGNKQYKTRHLQIVPNCAQNGYNQITQLNDLGVFFTDGLGRDANNVFEGSNLTSGMVIAPWAANRNASVGGIRIDNLGNVEIHGNTRTTKLNVDVKWWSDFVFKPDYKLMSLGTLEAFIKTNGHLPGMPKEADVLEQGIDIANMQALHQQKIEELTLYIIELQKQLQNVQAQLVELKK